MELDALRALIEVRPDGTIAARAGATLTPESLAALGLSRRETEEFAAKLTPKGVPSFEVTLEQSTSPEIFEKRFADAVPRIDSNTTDSK
ncbi:MAG: hypothetical protein QM784_13300 [Polyangiaceae bacterium]